MAQQRTNPGAADPGVKAWSRISESEYWEGNPKQMDQSSRDTTENCRNPKYGNNVNAWPAYSTMRKQSVKLDQRH